MDGTLIKQFAEAVEDLKQYRAKIEAETQANGAVTAETKAALAKLHDRLDQLETRLYRPQFGGDSLKTAEEIIQQAQIKDAFFNHLLRKGVCPPEFVKILQVSDDVQGGYLAIADFRNEIIKGIIEFSPIRTVARVITTSNRSVQIPKRTGVFAAAWVAETGTRTERPGLAYGLEDIPAHEMYALHLISQQMLEDAEFDMESELRGEFEEQFGVAEGTAFISGNGVGKPEGLLSNASIQTTNSGHASQLTADGMIALFYAIKTAYANNGTWAMHRQTIRDVRTLKDGNGQYLWQSGLELNRPPTILSRPYIECPDMPTVAAAAKPIIFGDFRRGYVIADRVQMSVLRDPYSQSTIGCVQFIARKRVGGQVVLPEALRTMTISV